MSVAKSGSERKQPVSKHVSCHGDVRPYSARDYPATDECTHLFFFSCVYLPELLSNVNPSKMLIFKQLGDERSSKLWQCAAIALLWQAAVWSAGLSGIIELFSRCFNNRVLLHVLS